MHEPDPTRPDPTRPDNENEMISLIRQLAPH